MYKLTVTKQEENPKYDPKYKPMYGYNEEIPQKYIEKTHLEVTLTDEEYEAIKKAVLSIK